MGYLAPTVYGDEATVNYADSPVTIKRAVGRAFCSQRHLVRPSARDCPLSKSGPSEPGVPSGERRVSAEPGLGT
jgi:hypothetical protein